MQKGVSMRCYKEGMGWECSSVVERELTLAQDHGFTPKTTTKYRRKEAVQWEWRVGCGNEGTGGLLGEGSEVC
jgi:hypothetical protein